MEELTLLERFVEVGAEAERAAFSRPHEWDDTTPWFPTTRDSMNRLWVAERLIRIQFPLAVHDAARKYFLDLNRTVWEGLPDGESVRRLPGGQQAGLSRRGPSGHGIATAASHSTPVGRSRHTVSQEVGRLDEAPIAG